MLNELDFAIVYLDDILIKRKTREERARHVKEVFKKIEFGFKLSIEKYDFFFFFYPKKQVFGIDHRWKISEARS